MLGVPSDEHPFSPRCCREGQVAKTPSIAASGSLVQQLASNLTNADVHDGAHTVRTTGGYTFGNDGLACDVIQIRGVDMAGHTGCFFPRKNNSSPETVRQGISSPGSNTTKGLRKHEAITNACVVNATRRRLQEGSSTYSG